MRCALYFILVKVVIILCHKQNLEKTKVLLNMAYQTVDMPPSFCNMSQTNFHDLTLYRALRLCTGNFINADTHIVGITTILNSADDSIKDIKSSILASSVKLSNGFRLYSSSTTLKTLSLRQVTTINRYTKSLMFLQKFSVVMPTLKKKVSRDQYDKLTVEQMVQKYSRISSEETNTMIESWFGNTTAELGIDVRSYTLANISSAINTTDVDEVLKLTMSDAIFMVLSRYSEEQMMFLPLQFVGRICYPLVSERSLKYVRETCVQTGLQHVVSYDASDKYTLSQVNELFSKSKVGNMDYVTMKLHVNDITSRLQEVIDWPLVVSACKAGVKPESIPARNLLTLTMKILNKLTNVANIKSKNVLRGILGISEYTIGQLEPYTFQLLIITESAIENAKQLYTLSMRTIYAIMDGRVSKQSFLNKEFPKYITLISQYNITFLQKCYGFNFKKAIKKESVSAILARNFGVSEATMDDYFDISTQTKENSLLNKTDSFATVQSVMPKNINPKSGVLNDKSLYDVLMNTACTMPSLISLLKVTPLSTPTYLGIPTRNLTLVKHYVTGNKYGVRIPEMERHIRCVYYQYSFLPPAEIAMVFKNYNLTKMSLYHNIDFKRRKWLDVLRYIQKDVAFVKFLDIDFSAWPKEFRDCKVYRLSCNMFTLFSRSTKRSIEEVGRRLKIDPPYDEHVATTPFLTYRHLLNLTVWDIWGKSFRKMLINMSLEYIRLNHTLIDMTVLEHINRTNATVYNASSLPLYELFNSTADLPLDRLPYYYYFKGKFYEKYVARLKDLNLTAMNTYELRNYEPLLFPGGGLFVLTWSEVFDYFLRRVTHERLRDIRDFRIRDVYLNTTTSDLFELYGLPEDFYFNSSIIQIAEDVLGITRETVTRITDLSLTSHDAEVLWFVTINQLEWILPHVTYNESTLYEVINTTTYKEVWVFGSTFNMLAKRINYFEPYVNNTSYVESLLNLTNCTTDEIFDFLDDRVVPKDTEKSIVLKFQKSLLYRREMAYFSLQFNQTSVISLAKGLYGDIDRCTRSELFCNDTYGPSLCVESSGGYGFECACVSGFINYGYYCQDINECLVEHMCMDYVTCINYNGSYDCVGECDEGYCPSDSMCTDIAAGPACRCPGSKFYHYEWKDCLEGDAFIYVGGLSIQNVKFLKNYGAKNSTAFVDLANYVETSIRVLLQPEYPAVAAVEVIKLGGALDFVVVLTKNGSDESEFPQPAQVTALLLDGIDNGTTLEKIYPAINSSLIANTFDLCAFERPVESGGYCESEETRICNGRNCPTGSTCVSLFTGILCRCYFGTFLEGYMGYSETCVDGEYFIKVGDVILPFETYHDVYDVVSSKARLEYSMFMEADILNFLQPLFSTAAAVQAVGMGKTDDGLMKMDFLINFKKQSSSDRIPSASEVEDAIKSAINYRSFGSLYVGDPDALFFRGGSVACDLVTCINPDRKKIVNPDDNPGVYIGIPVAIMFLILLVIIYLIMRQKPNRNRVGII